MDDTKDKIIEAGILIMTELGDVRKVTMRDIAERAGVGLGLINYHFRTKDELIRLATRTFIGRVIGEWGKGDRSGKIKDPVRGLRAALTEVSDFLAAYPRISRISILFDLENPAPGDNSEQSIESLCPSVAACLSRTGEASETSEARELTRMIIGGMQHVFLRSPEGEDFFDATWRKSWLERIVGLVAAVSR